MCYFRNIFVGFGCLFLGACSNFSFELDNRYQRTINGDNLRHNIPKPIEETSGPHFPKKEEKKYRVKIGIGRKHGMIMIFRKF